MTVPQEPLRWKNSSSGEDTCVDLAHTLRAVRDSKNADGPTLAVNVRPLIAAIQAGQLDR
jgi:hypothetical protein